MSQNLLAALGARIEAQLKLRHTHARSLEDSVKAKVNIAPPKPFMLVPDDAGTLSYLPGTNERTIPITKQEVDSQPLVPNLTPETFPSAADISAAIAPFAALFNNSAQVLIEPAVTTAADTITPASGTPTASAPVDVAELPVTEAPVAATPMAGTPMAATPVVAAPVSGTPFAAKPVATPTVAATPVVAAAPSVAPAATPAAADSAAPAARVLPPDAQILADGTIIANLVPNVTPMVPPEFSIGATVRRKGVPSDPPMTVTVDYNGLIRATVTDGNGTRTFESQWNQFELVTRAPGS